MKVKCDVCDGKGFVKRLINYSDFYYEGDHPIYEDEPCEDCIGGEQEVENES